MGTVTTHRSLLLAGVVVAAAAACSSPRSTPQQRADGRPHRGTLALIVRGDTTVRDDYVRGDTALQGTVRPLVRGAKFGWARYDVRFARTGEVRRVVLSLGRVGTSPDMAPVSTHSTTFGPDSITQEWPNKPPTSTAYRRGAVPVFGPSIAMFQEVIRRARALTAAKGTAEIPTYSLLNRSAVELVRVTWVAPETAEVQWGDSPGVRYNVDAAGNILRGQGASGEFITVRLR
jgi:hypothetical protein